VDWENLLEEIEDMARRELRSLISFMAVIMEHLYKWENFRYREDVGHSWISSINNARNELDTIFETYPSIRKKSAEELPTAWRIAVKRLVRWFKEPQNQNLAKKYFGKLPTEKDFPQECPYTFEQVMEYEPWVTSLGNFSGWDIRGFNTSFLQEQKGNIISQGGRVEGKGLSVDNALRLAAIRGDDFTRNVIAEMSAIAGQGASASMVINPQGRLEQAEMVSGDGGFRVVYDGRGRLAVMKGGVEHGSIELDEKGEIKGFETNVQLGNMTAEYVKSRANEYRELASAYGQVANTLKNLFSENRSAKDFENFRKALSKIGERNFSAILEVAKALGLDKTIAEELVKLYGDKYSEEYRNRNATEFGIKLGAKGEFSAKLGVGEGGGLLPIKLSGGATGYLDISTGRIYTDEDLKAMSAYMSNEERNQLVEKLTRSLQDKLGKSSSSSQSKRTDTAYTQGKEYSEGVDQSKVYEVAENFSKKAEEMHARADSLQVSLKQDPLHYYAQQKYKEALRAGKSKGEAVRYAMEEVAKLRSNPEALEKWLNEFAKEQGIQPPDVNKEKLNNIPNEVPREEDIKKEGEKLQKKVAGRIDDTREKISEERKKLERYQPPTVPPQLSENMFRLKEDEFRLNLGLSPKNDPRFTPHANKAKEWYKNQPNPLRRAFNDVVDLGVGAGQFVIDLGKNAINTVNAVDQAARKIDSQYENIRYKP
jgi:hypothetical protein